MKFKPLALVTAATLLIVGCTDTPSAVVKCFCQQLDSQRKAELQDDNGVPTTVWPDIGKVDICIQTSRGGSLDDADGALQQERRTGALDGDDGVVLCTTAGYQVDETTPEPASPAVMQAARESFCKIFAEPEAPDGESEEQITADSKKKTEQQISTFAAQMGISQQAAETALNRAASESEAGKFKCP